MVVSSRQGIVAEWTVTHGTIPTSVRIENIGAGEHIDFVVSCRDNDTYDSYSWQVMLTLENSGDRANLENRARLPWTGLRAAGLVGPVRPGVVDV